MARVAFPDIKSSDFNDTSEEIDLNDTVQENNLFEADDKDDSINWTRRYRVLRLFNRKSTNKPKKHFPVGRLSFICGKNTENEEALPQNVTSLSSSAEVDRHIVTSCTHPAEVKPDIVMSFPAELEPTSQLRGLESPPTSPYDGDLGLGITSITSPDVTSPQRVYSSPSTDDVASNNVTSKARCRLRRLRQRLNALRRAGRDVGRRMWTLLLRRHRRSHSSPTCNVPISSFV